VSHTPFAKLRRQRVRQQVLVQLSFYLAAAERPTVAGFGSHLMRMSRKQRDAERLEGKGK
jgi:hypothetical protein